MKLLLIALAAVVTVVLLPSCASDDNYQTPSQYATHHSGYDPTYGAQR